MVERGYGLRVRTEVKSDVPEYLSCLRDRCLSRPEGSIGPGTTETLEPVQYSKCLLQGVDIVPLRH